MGTMTVEDRATFRSVILPAESAPSIYRAEELLSDLGHEVAAARSPQHALDLLEQDQTDLLIVDISDSARNRAFVAQLSEMPESLRPRQVAIFSDTMDESLRGLRTRLKPGKLHIFLKPLHMHGLLSVLRQLESHDTVAQV
jgi:CheY-like chemotaxis protein